MHDSIPTTSSHVRFLILDDNEILPVVMRDCLLLSVLPFVFMQSFLGLRLLYFYGMVVVIAGVMIAPCLVDVSIPYVIIWMLFALYAVKGNHLQHLEHFLALSMAQKRSRVSAQSSVNVPITSISVPPTVAKEQIREEMMAVETKHLVANVAHDLKTVSVL